MRVIDSAKLPIPGQKTSPLNRLVETVKARLIPPPHYKDMPAIETVVTVLSKVLDQRFVMIRNVMLEGPNVLIPLILVGPPGVRVLVGSALKGVYRAREDSWESLDERSQHYKPERPNLITRAGLMGRAVNAYLATHDVHLEDIETALCFSDPGIHIDASRPAIRLVMVDALERYGASLLQSRITLEQDEIKKIVDTLLGEKAQTAEPDASAEIRDKYSFLDLPPDEMPHADKQIILDHSEPRLFQKVPFSRRQLILLGVMIFANITLLVILALVVLLTS